MPRALACPASLKGVLPAPAAAGALAEGLRDWSDADVLPIADGGDGTLDVLHAALGGDWREAEVADAFGRPRCARWLQLPDGTAAIEAAEAIPLDPSHLDPLTASSRGLGELIASVGSPVALLVSIGGTATMDAGAGLREVIAALPAPTRVACDVDVRLNDAPRVFGPQKGATPEMVAVLEARFAEMHDLAEFADVAGGGAAGGLGAALAALGAALVPGAGLVLNELRFDPLPYDLVVTGEGTVDATTVRGKAPGEVARRCAAVGVRCVVFGGRVVEPVEGAESVELSGDRSRAREDLIELGRRLRLR